MSCRSIPNTRVDLKPMIMKISGMPAGEKNTAKGDLALHGYTYQEHISFFFDLAFRPEPSHSLFSWPKVAILRKQDVSGQVGLAWTLTAVGFDAVGVHMSDILSGRIDFSDFQELIVCGSFPYGNILGAGKGWANLVSYARPRTFRVLLRACRHFRAQRRQRLPAHEQPARDRLRRERVARP